MIRSTAVTVNGALRPLAGFPVHTSLLDFLRGQGLTGAKEGCAEGECGACAVLVARPDGARSGWVALNACLVPAAAYDGQEVVTAEGIGGPERLHPVQREMAERGGSQCGYCTPGFVCSMAAEYYRPQRATAGSTDGVHSSTPFDVEALSGNLCRCTGYRPIRMPRSPSERRTRPTPCRRGSPHRRPRRRQPGCRPRTACSPVRRTSTRP